MKKQRSLFFPFILIKSTGGCITFEVSNWFHKKKFKLILLLIFNKLRRKEVLNIGKLKSKFYIKEIDFKISVDQTSLIFFTKKDKSYTYYFNKFKNCCFIILL